MMHERPFLQLVGLAGGIIALHQGLDLFTAGVAADLGSPTGRLGIVAVVWSRSPALLAADLFLVTAAFRSARPGAQAALAGAHLALGLCALLLAPFFLMDAGRVTGSIALTELTSFRITVARVLLALVAVGAGAVVLGVTLFQTARGQPRAA